MEPSNAVANEKRGLSSALPHGHSPPQGPQGNQEHEQAELCRECLTKHSKFART